MIGYAARVDRTADVSLRFCPAGTNVLEIPDARISLHSGKLSILIPRKTVNQEPHYAHVRFL